MVEDDKNLCNTVKHQLELQSYQVDTCYCGDDALLYLSQNIYDLIILDRMLPNIDGLSVLRTIRQKNIPTPVILVTALDQINNKIEGLDAGADDYLAKPFIMEELFARIRALLRRPVSLVETNTLSYSDLTLNLTSKKLSCQSIDGITSCILSKKELDLFEFFMRNKEQVLERELILSRVWNDMCSTSSGNLDNYISFLRRRLRNLNSNVRIQTIHSIGYEMEEIKPC